MFANCPIPILQIFAPEQYIGAMYKNVGASVWGHEKQRVKKNPDTVPLMLQIALVRR
jgi:hypothetical protein